MTTPRKRLGAGLSKLIAMGTIADEAGIVPRKVFPPPPIDDITIEVDAIDRHFVATGKVGTVLTYDGRTIAYVDPDGSVRYPDRDEELERLRARRDELLVNCNRLEQEARDARSENRRLREKLLAE